MYNQSGMNPHNPANEFPADQNRNNLHTDHVSHQQQMHETCKNLYLHFVQFQTMEGQMLDGIIEDVDEDGVTMLIPDGDAESAEGMERQFGYGYGGFYYPWRFRRFRRFRFPFFGIRRLFFPFYY
ncbi:hypothetical protein [Gracilibacillus alcaliphilus]|uniref:hypothetical protein n=1 Tax=Gracilibacillus alcaliphilus TaxID=1401441 RepID=UPI00195D96C9|nr:hypothetical protein [Gracilibacillus alcaliphilus]MBM7678791.1 hypothetical protein [Gracilibacillus alcaliphilus]